MGQDDLLVQRLRVLADLRQLTDDQGEFRRLRVLAGHHLLSYLRHGLLELVVQNQAFGLVVNYQYDLVVYDQRLNFVLLDQ